MKQIDQFAMIVIGLLKFDTLVFYMIPSLAQKENKQNHNAI